MRPILFILLWSIVLPLDAKPLFKGFTAEYDVIRNDMLLGVSKRQLVVRQHGSVLNYAATTIPEGLVALFVSDKFMEHSLIHITPRGLQPISYEYQQTGGSKEVTFHAKFDWQHKQILMSNHQQPQPLPSNAQDLLSFQLAIMQGLEQGQRQFRFHIVDHKRIQLQTLNYSNTEQIRSSLGKLDLLQLENKSNQANYRFTFWCAAQLHYLPVKIRKIEHDGDVILLKLRRLNRQDVQLYDEAPTDEED